MRISAFVLAGLLVCRSVCLLGWCLALLLRIVIAFVGGSHSAAYKVVECFGSAMKVIALFVEKSLSGMHTSRLDNVLGQ